MKRVGAWFGGVLALAVLSWIGLMLAKARHRAVQAEAEASRLRQVCRDVALAGTREAADDAMHASWVAEDAARDAWQVVQDLKLSRTIRERAIKVTAAEQAAARKRMGL